jgi:hypothetical protein
VRKGLAESMDIRTRVDLFRLNIDYSYLLDVCNAIVMGTLQ